MNKKIVSIISIVAIMLLSESVLAAGSSITARIQEQESRIQKGCDKGQLTEKEEAALKREQRNIKSMIKSLSRDHVVSSNDQIKIHAALNKASVNIFKKRYNRETKRKGRDK